MSASFFWPFLFSQLVRWVSITGPKWLTCDRARCVEHPAHRFGRGTNRHRRGGATKPIFTSSVRPAWAFLACAFFPSALFASAAAAATCSTASPTNISHAGGLFLVMDAGANGRGFTRNHWGHLHPAGMGGTSSATRPAWHGIRGPKMYWRSPLSLKAERGPGEGIPGLPLFPSFLSLLFFCIPLPTWQHGRELSHQTVPRRRCWRPFASRAGFTIACARADAAGCAHWPLVAFWGGGEDWGKIEYLVHSRPSCHCTPVLGPRALLRACRAFAPPSTNVCPW